MKHMNTKKALVVFYLINTLVGEALPVSPTPSINIDAHIEIFLSDHNCLLLAEKFKDLYETGTRFYQETQAQTNQKFLQTVYSNIFAALLPVLIRQKSEIDKIGTNNLKEALTKVVFALSESSKEFLEKNSTKIVEQKEIFQVLETSQKVLLSGISSMPAVNNQKQIDDLFALIQPDLLKLCGIITTSKSITGLEPLLDLCKTKLAQTLSVKDCQTLELFLKSQTYSLLKQNYGKIILALRKSVTPDIQSELEYMILDIWSHAKTTLGAFLKKINV